MSNSLVRIENPICISREVDLRLDQGYGIGRTGLISSWKVLDEGVKLNMFVNGLRVGLESLNGSEFNISKIRNELRDLVPFTEEETKLCNIESTIFGTQLLATEFYRYFPSKYLFDFIFTGDLCITFKPADKKFPEKISIEETYVISEAQLNQKLQQGIPIDKIGGKEEGISMGI
jgi:hypothetical protein